MHFLGLKFNRFSIELMASMDKFLKFVPFGMYWRIRPLVFSLVSLSQVTYKGTTQVIDSLEHLSRLQ